jgi:hypothetical protein
VDAMPRIKQNNIILDFCPACGTERDPTSMVPLNVRQVVDFLTDSKNMESLRVVEGTRKVIMGKKKITIRTILIGNKAKSKKEKPEPIVETKVRKIFKNVMTLKVECLLCKSVVIEEHTGTEILKMFEKGENVCKNVRSYEYNQKIIEWMVQKFLQEKDIGKKMQEFAENISSITGKKKGEENNDGKGESQGVEGDEGAKAEGAKGDPKGEDPSGKGK